MENSFFPRTWRSKDIDLTQEELELSIGQCDLLRIERKLVQVITDFIRGIFNYDNIKVTFQETELYNNKNVTGYSAGKLDSEDGHVKFHFATRAFNDKFYEFTVANIPVTTDSRNIKIFFQVIQEYIGNFYDSIKDTITTEESKLVASPSRIKRSDIWLYNIERTIIVEYIYHLFNTFDENYSSKFKIAPGGLRYNIDEINSIIDFSFELSAKKVENKEIYCGFIFHDNESEVIQNSVRSIKFDKPFDFGDFNQLKNYLEVSNGQNIFFNVTDSKITAVFITRDKLNEIYYNPIGDGKRFQNRPLIVSIQGNGKIHFLEGRSDNNKIILQIINSRPVIRDNGFIQKFIYDVLNEFSNAESRIIDIFSKWVMSLSQKKHGTSLIFTESTDNVEKTFVKTAKIHFENSGFMDGENLRHELSLLSHIVNPDGAVVFGINLVPSYLSTILPIDQSGTGTSGGARHNSVSNFTKSYSCLGIVISDDGPITIFRNGEKLIKF